ncbi:MAG: hypothetical protein ACN6O8_02745 [Achromobacter sp.]|uniref:hypothetical protein n=1 Tax=Achromobacter sp. TaxID=134375 RepID=UPI003D028B44
MPPQACRPKHAKQSKNPENLAISGVSAFLPMLFVAVFVAVRLAVPRDYFHRGPKQPQFSLS